MAATKVLIPLDGSKATLRALKKGLARVAGPVTVTGLVVMDARLMAMPEDAREHLEWDDEDEIILRDDEAKAVLEAAKQAASSLKGVTFHGKVIKGDVVDAVVKESKTHDVLLMHALRRIEAEDQERGSKTEKIARAASCDVLLVHDPEFK